MKMTTKMKLILAGALTVVLIALIGVLTFYLVSSNSLERKLEQANVYYQEGNYEDSIALTLEILDEEPRYVSARLLLSFNYFATEQYDLEEATLLEGIELDPEEPQYYYYLSDHYMYFSKVEEAILTTSDGVAATEDPELQEQLDELGENLSIVMGTEDAESLVVQVGYGRVLQVVWEDEYERHVVSADWSVMHEELGSIEQVEVDEDGNIVDPDVVDLNGNLSGSEAGDSDVDGADEAAESETSQDADAGTADGDEFEASDDSTNAEDSTEAGDFEDGDGVDSEENATDGDNDSGLATIFSANELGSTVLTASVGLIQLDVEMDVREHVLREIVSVGPSDIDLTVGEAVTLSVSGSDYAGEDMDDFSPTWELSREIGTLTEVDPFTYEFTAEEGGIETVVVSDGDVELEIHIVVNQHGNYISSSVTGQGHIVRTPNEDSYIGNSVVVVQAVPADGWTFVEWRGDLTGSENPAELVMNSNKSIEAVFAVDGYDLTMRVNGQGEISPQGGSESVSGDGGSITTTYGSGDSVTLRAQAADGWVFDRWEGAVSGTSSVTTIVMDSNKSVTAVFVERQPDNDDDNGDGSGEDEAEEVTLTIEPPRNGKIEGATNGQKFEKGSKVTLTAVPDQGYEFSHWSYDGYGNTNPYEYTLDRNLTISAEFREVEEDNGDDGNDGDNGNAENGAENSEEE